MASGEAPTRIPVVDDPSGRILQDRSGPVKA
jgi:hypothetical protein